MPDTIESLKNAIIDSVKARAKDFLDQNADAKDFLVDRAQRLAKLTYQYAMAGDEAEKTEIKEKMDLVTQTIENEMSAIAVGAQSEAKNMFKAILGTALDTVVKALPVILAAI